VLPFDFDSICYKKQLLYLLVKRVIIMKYNFDQGINRLNTCSEKWDGLKKRFGVKDVIPMWVADMDFMSPPQVREALKKRVEHGVYGYTFRPESYFTAVIDWLEKRHQWTIQNEWISHSPGVIPALSLIIQTFTQPGDKIMIQTPVYHAFSRVIKAQNRTVVSNPLKFENRNYTMDFSDLEAKIDPAVKMIILCSPHNPVGRVWNRDELTKLGEICIKHNILVVSDEIHFDLIYKGSKHIPFASISSDFADLSITCIAPSKTFNLLGLHTSSVIISNSKLRRSYNKAVNELSLGSPNIFGMIASESAYRDGEEWLNQLIDYLQGNLDFVMQFLKEHIPQIKVIPPEGTYLVWLDFQQLRLSTKDLDHFMLHKAKVALNEGHIFGEEGKGFMRMNIACPRSTLEKALYQIRDAVITLYNT
jgi:cysteine-S-conjugate beta-lyase